MRLVKVNFTTMTKTPTFLILGAGKSGTTSLYHYMAEHPNVYMSEPKEPIFFEAEYEKGLEYYWHKYFSGWKGEQAIGEARPTKLYLPFVPKRLHESLPKAKLIAILRNPIDRAYSAWWMNVCNGKEDLSFEEAIQRDLDRMEAGINFEGESGERLWRENLKNEKINIYLDEGYYAKQLKRYLELFPLSQLKVILFEDLCSDLQAVMSELWEFIGVNPKYELKDKTPRNVAVPQMVLRMWRLIRKTGLNQIFPEHAKTWLRFRLSRLSKGKPKMGEETREFLIAHYYKHNRELEKILQRDLSNWDR